MQITPRLLVYGYGRRDSPRLQAALSAAVQLTAAVTPEIAEAAVREVTSNTCRLHLADRVRSDRAVCRAHPVHEHDVP